MVPASTAHGSAPKLSVRPGDPLTQSTAAALFSRPSLPTDRLRVLCAVRLYIGLTEWLFGSETPDDRDDGDDRPPKPDDEHRGEERDVTRYKATVEYRNGDTETFECYGVERSDGQDTLRFKTDPYATVSGLSPPTHLSVSYDHRVEHYETLAREPVLEEIAEDTFRLEATVEHVWDYGPVLDMSMTKDWRPRFSETDLTVNPDD